MTALKGLNALNAVFHTKGLVRKPQGNQTGREIGRLEETKQADTNEGCRCCISTFRCLGF
jgi:hypothetical protein